MEINSVFANRVQIANEHFEKNHLEPVTQGKS